ncbi:NADH dehydrogenase [ubiquinone] iron-sulfur protein 5-like [Chlorocebus sabaeus]|uniref:NADH dehydrogenase [ubiquinone] iron-sulfur protein 5-like n=1 Tax=Chlorocebus sabaeus TaxID=60711 RepID=UPI0018B0A8D9|nr:NADH dehydrogenase [ubiquinone] iron-sulfur protein 5-like [Chlorocebus sabaeus]
MDYGGQEIKDQGTVARERQGHEYRIAVPFLDIQQRFSLNIDQRWTIQSAEQPYKIVARCRAFEKEWIECAHGISVIQAEKECKIEYDDFVECLLRQKMMGTIRKQQDMLIKEGKDTPPSHHIGKEEPRP